jgi:tetratricopeptide (TPR) repeat protein
LATLGLVMIVRDEAHGIRATLESVRSVLDAWTIYDTGSTDGTQAIVREVLADIHGELHEGPFVDFSSARNRVLDLHGIRTTWSLMLDADDIVERPEALRAAIDRVPSQVDALLIRRQITTSWFVPLMLRCGRGWRYHGRVHEYAAGPDRSGAQYRVEDCTIRHDRPPQSLEAVRARWKRDRTMLEQDLAAGVDLSRTLYYLGQTCECLGDLDQAEKYYAQRIETPGWQPETFEARLRRGRCLLVLGRFKKAVAVLLDAHGADPDRCEPLVELAAYYRKAGNHDAAYLFARRAVELPNDQTGLFIDDDAYTFRRHDELAVAAYYVGRRRGDKRILLEGRAAADAAVAARPTDQRALRNRAFFD